MAGLTDIRTFSGGMNKDIDYSLLKSDTYIDAQNFKLIADDSSNGFILENAEGNSLEVDMSALPGMSSAYSVAGYCFIQPYLVLFVTTDETEPEPDNTGTCKILRFTVDRDEIQEYSILYTDGSGKGDLNFSLVNPIKAVGVYETDEIIKVYWTDGYNELRFLNIMGDVSGYNVTEFSFVPDYPTLGTTTDTRIEFVEMVDGALTAGSVQYTYQYYSTNGASTRFAPLSPPIAIPKGDPDGSFSSYRGGIQGEETGNGCKLKLNIPTTKPYDRVRIVALDYETANDVPRVRVVSENIINTSSSATTLYFTDIGQVVTELVYEDFLTYGNTTYKSKDVEIKDNMLFIGNIDEDVYDVDFDCRAYRFNDDGTPTARVYQSNGSYYTIQTNGDWTYSGGGSGSNWEIPETADCINRYNDPTYEGNSSYQYKYRSSGSPNYGASGPNVSVSFATNNDLQIDTSAGSASYNPSSGESTSYPINTAYKRSWQRQEVYRFGIVFYDQKMRASSVKWVCDLKMPMYSDSASTYVYSTYSSPNTTARLLGVTISLNSAPSDYYRWQIVCAPRTASDRSVVANCLLQTPYKNTTPSPNQYHPDSDVQGSASGTTCDMTVVNQLHDSNYLDYLNILISPEINFYQDLEHKSGDYLQVIGYLTHPSTHQSIPGNRTKSIKFVNFSTGGAVYTDSDHRTDVTDVTIVAQNSDPEATVNIGPYQYNNYAQDSSGNNINGLGGTCAVAYTATPLGYGDATSNWNDKVALVSYRRDVFNSQYGGNDYYSRQRTEYIGCSELRGTTGSTTTYEGDTFIDFFMYQRQAFDLLESGNDPDTYQIFAFFPIESTIALSLRSDPRIGVTPTGVTLIREVAGTWEAQISTRDYKITHETDMYQYNPAYSIVNIGQKFYDQLLDQSEQTYFPTRVRHSDIKQNGEIQDSFTVFRAANFIDLDGRKGPVNNLVNFNNSLYYWQNTGFGVLSVNTRALIQDNNPGILALGSGGVLDRYDYLSETVGNVNDHGIIKSNKSLYWLDNNKNEIFRYSGKEEPLSKLNGVQTWLTSKGKVGWMHGVYDSKYNDVVFTMTFSRPVVAAATPVTRVSMADPSGLWLHASAGPYFAIIDGRYDTTNKINARYNEIEWYSGDTNPLFDVTKAPLGDSGSDYYVTLPNADSLNTYTLVYNEQVGKFVSFASYEPYKYISLNNNFLSTNNGHDLYKHNSGEKCEYYGVHGDSTITTVFNKDYANTKVFDVVKWVSESVDTNGINQFADTFTSVEMWDDYQHTGYRDLYYQHTPSGTFRPVPISRRERTWSMNVPRNIVDQSGRTQS